MTRADLLRLEARVLRRAAGIVAEYGHGATALLNRVAAGCDERATTEPTDETGCPRCGYPNPPTPPAVEAV